jgi:hypothetical protein
VPPRTRQAIQELKASHASVDLLDVQASSKIRPGNTVVVVSIKAYVEG